MRNEKSPTQNPGRPPIHGERLPLGLRVTKEMKLKLDQAAMASGRSQSQEAELRLEQTFSSENILFDALDLAYGRHWTGLLLAMAQAGQITGTRAISASQDNFDGCEDWVRDPYAYDQVVRAIGFVLESFRPRGNIVLPAKTYLPAEAFERLGEGFARGFLAAVVSRSEKQAQDGVAQSVRQRLADLIEKVRIPPDTPIGPRKNVRT